MSIPKSQNKIKAHSDDLPVEIVAFKEMTDGKSGSPLKRYFILLLVLLVSMCSFGLGRLSTMGQESRMEMRYDPSLSALGPLEAGTTTPNIIKKSTTRPKTRSTAAVSNSVGPLPTDGQVVASSKGTKYHYPDCPGAKTISPKNKIAFHTALDAEAAGYTLALNCKVR